MVMDYCTAFIIIVYPFLGCYFGIFMPVFLVVVVIVNLFCIICFVKNPKSAGAPLALINN
jgi:hypothetical protein